MFAEIGEPGPRVRERRLVDVPVPGGTIEALVYVPPGAGPHPAHVFVHGGGWGLGSIHHAIVDATCRERCVGASCVVVSVGYRKAPEHAFPVPLDDAFAAVRWVVDHAETLDVRRDLVTIGGQSAGGNLAAAVALRARDEGGPAIAFQLLEIPALDLTFAHPSVATYATGFGLTARDMEQFRDAYVRVADDTTHPYASPLLAPDLAGLPPAHVMVAEYDVLRDEGEAYAHRLNAAGVPATLAMHAGHIHGSGSYTAVMASARAWRDEVVATLRAVHDGRRSDPAPTVAVPVP
jgi:acetyl esterase